MGLTDKKHIYLISGSELLLEQLRPLAEEYLFSHDSDGRLLKRINGNGKNRDIDIVVTEFEFFRDYINVANKPDIPAFAPNFIVLLNQHNVASFEALSLHFNCFPSFLPFDFEQFKSILAAVLNNRKNILKLEERERFKKLFQKVPIAQMLLNPCDLIILDANRAAEELYGLPDERSLSGNRFTDLHPGFTEILGEKIKEAQKFGASQLGIPLERNHKGTLDLSLAISKILIGKRVLLYISIQDISEAKEAERILTRKNLELQKTNSELDNFVYSTSHELRAPLMSVLGLISLLETEADKREQNLYLNLMKGSIQKLDNIIHDIIDYSRNARFDVIISPVDFHFILEKTTNNLQFIQGFEKIEVRKKIKGEVPFYSDRRRVEIVVNNLISNGLKFYNPVIEKPFVDVLVQVNENHALIRVEDNGRGIPKNHLPRIFDMFFRGHEQSTGGGLGLYILKEIVEKLNGHIHIESTEGLGSVFTIKLPNQFQK